MKRVPDHYFVLVCLGISLLFYISAAGMSQDPTEVLMQAAPVVVVVAIVAMVMWWRWNKGSAGNEARTTAASDPNASRRERERIRSATAFGLIVAGVGALIVALLVLT